MTAVRPGVNRAPVLCALACSALMAACSESRASAPAPPVYDADVAPILQAHCVGCHGDTNPAGGWTATSFLHAIACLAPSSAPATLPPDPRAPLLAALEKAPHRGLLSTAERTVLASWVAGGTLAFHGSFQERRSFRRAARPFTSTGSSSRRVEARFVHPHPGPPQRSPHPCRTSPRPPPNPSCSSSPSI